MCYKIILLISVFLLLLLSECRIERLKVIRLIMLNSTDHDIYHARNVIMPTNFDILTLISTVNTALERFKARKFFIV